MPTRYLLLCACVLALSFMWSVPAEARIDPDSIVGIWLFDDDKGGKALDSSGNELHGQINGNPAEVEGKFGSALEFTGGGDTVELVRFGLDFPTDIVTIVTWAKVKEVKGQDLCSTVPLDPDRIVFHLNERGDGVSWALGRAPFSVAADFDEAWVDQWKHWAMFTRFSENRDDKISGIYLDGEEHRIFGKLAGQWVPRDAGFHIGGRPGSSFGGVMDEFAIIDTVLSQSQIDTVAVGTG